MSVATEFQDWLLVHRESLLTEPPAIVATKRERNAVRYAVYEHRAAGRHKAARTLDGMLKRMSDGGAWQAMRVTDMEKVATHLRNGEDPRWVIEWLEDVVAYAKRDPDHPTERA